MAKKKGPSHTGPRGGTTTRSKDGSLIKKVFWIGVEEAEALRRSAFDEQKTEASIVRAALRSHLRLPPPGKGRSGRQ